MSINSQKTNHEHQNMSQVNNTSYNEPAISTEMPTSQQKATYATAIRQSPEIQLPTNTQAIIFQSLENTELIAYLKAIGNITGTKNMRFSSRITGSRTGIYLPDKSHVDKIITHH